MKPTLECPLCGNEVESQAEYCPECGETLKRE
ncbi:zinc-ribbon domain-containing protein [Candidatus Woesearchaeota archaeon]|nr:zinc-ribbon domain-containing protein [Candidatus Woesearchaeota archaeon]